MGFCTKYPKAKTALFKTLKTTIHKLQWSKAVHDS